MLSIEREKTMTNEEIMSKLSAWNEEVGETRQMNSESDEIGSKMVERAEDLSDVATGNIAQGVGDELVDWMADLMPNTGDNRHDTIVFIHAWDQQVLSMLMANRENISDDDMPIISENLENFFAAVMAASFCKRNNLTDDQVQAAWDEANGNN